MTASVMRICDWSSDVCSSDRIGPDETMVLPYVAASNFECEAGIAVVIGKRASHVAAADAMAHVFGYVPFLDGSARGLPPDRTTFFQIGRASCRERVCQYV